MSSSKIKSKLPYLIMIIFVTFLSINVFNAYAVAFTDHFGYIPSWASTMGQNQALSVCTNSVQYGTDDSKWCGEFSGYTLDQLSKTSGNTPSQQSTVPEFGSIAGIVIILSLIGSIIISKRFSVFNRH